MSVVDATSLREEYHAQEMGELRSLQKRKEEGNSDAEVQGLCVKSSRGVSQLGNREENPVLQFLSSHML